MKINQGFGHKYDRLFYLVKWHIRFLWISVAMIACYLILGCGSAYAGPLGEKWTKNDYIRQGAFTIALGVDWLQTRYISEHPDEYKEVGIARCFIGEHPDKSNVDIYFAAAWIAHTVITDLLDHKAEIFGIQFNPRKLWQHVTIGVEAGVDGHNISIGIGLEF